MPIAFTIDFERLSNTRAFRNLDADPRIRIDLKGITERILDLLDRTDNQATFYDVAEIAETKPELIRSIHEDGYEMKAPAASHRRLPRLDDDEARREVIDPKEHSKMLSGLRFKAFELRNLSIVRHH